MSHKFRLASLFVATTSVLSSLPIGYAASMNPLVARWGFDESGATIAIDALGRGNDAILSGGATRSEDVPAIGVPNLRSLALDGTGYATAGHIAFDKRSFTVNAWVKATDLSQEQTILSQRSFNVKDKSLRLSVTPTGAIDFSFNKDNLNTQDNVFTPNMWHNVSFTFDSKTLQRRIYVDGMMQATGTASGIYLGATGLTHIGRTDDGALGAKYWKGLMDEVRVYDGVLSDDAIMQLAKPTVQKSSSSMSQVSSMRDKSLAESVAARRNLRHRLPNVSSERARLLNRAKFVTRPQSFSSASSASSVSSATSSKAMIAPVAQGQSSSAKTMPMSGTLHRVTSFQLHLRKDSRATSVAILKLHEGDVIGVLEMLKNGWAKVQTGDGYTGYVHAGFIVPLQ